MCDEDSLLETCVGVLCALAVFSPEGHATVLKALEELALQVGTGNDEPRFRAIVTKLKERRHLRMRFHLQLINALVSGQDDREDRVQMREELVEVLLPIIARITAREA